MGFLVRQWRLSLRFPQQLGSILSNGCKHMHKVSKSWVLGPNEIISEVIIGTKQHFVTA